MLAHIATKSRKESLEGHVELARGEKREKRGKEERRRRRVRDSQDTNTICGGEGLKFYHESEAEAEAGGEVLLLNQR